MILILYGSLYPWHFEPRYLLHGPFWFLLHHWDSTRNPYFIHDMIVNVALYAPFGFFAGLAMAKRPLWAALAGPVLAAFLLSASIEFAQIYEPARVPSVPDILADVGGAMAGVLAAGIARIVKRPADPAAASLLCAWGVWLVFPLYPAFTSVAVRHKTAIFTQAQVFDLTEVISIAAIWLIAGLLFQSAKVRFVPLWLALATLLLPAQFFILDRQPLPSEFLGAIAGLALFSIRPHADKITAALFLTAVVVHDFARLPFAVKTTPFSFIPFQHFLTVLPAEFALSTLLGQLCFYSSAIWLLRTCGLRPLRATAIVAAMAVVTQIVFIETPGRLPGITDPLLAGLAGFLLAAPCPPQSSGEHSPFR